MRTTVRTILFAAAVLALTFGISLTTGAAQKTPGKVTLSAVATQSASAVQVKWKKVADADGYNIYRKTGSGAFQKAGTVKGAATVSFTDKKLKAGTVYTYTVKAYIGKKEGKYDTSGLKAQTAVTLAPSTKPLSGYAYNGDTKAYWAIQSRLNSFSGLDSSMLILKKGTYNLPGTVWIPSGAQIVLKDGVTLNKTTKDGGAYISSPGRLFIFMDAKNKGTANYAKGYKGVHDASVTGSGKAVINMQTTDGIAFAAVHAKNITISGITINLKVKNQKGVQIIGSTGVKVSNCTIKGSKEADRGIWIDLPSSKESAPYTWAKADNTVCKNLTISKCTFQSLQNAIYTPAHFMKGKYQTGITISGSKFKKLDQDAIRIFNWSAPKITDNTFDTIADGAVAMGGPQVAIRGYGLQNPVIQGNTFTNLSRPIFLDIKDSADTDLKGQGKTVNKITAAQWKTIETKNTVGNLGEYFATIKDASGDTTRHWFADTKTAYTMGPDDKPYRNQNVLLKEYTDAVADNDKAMLQNFAFRSYLEQIERNGGGTLTLKEGTYQIARRLHIPSNTTIQFQDGVVIKDVRSETGSKDKGPIFELLNKEDSGGTVKYTGHNGVHDVSFLGPETGKATIDKNFCAGTAMTLAHCKNVTIQGLTFLNMKGSAHFIEMDAAENVTIQHNVFKNCDTNSAKKGAINIDTPDENTGGFNSSYTSYDCTPNEDVLIYDNIFGSVPLAVETHLHTPGKTHKNIQIFDNLMDTFYFGVRARNWEDPFISGNEIHVHSDQVVNPDSSLSQCGILLEGVVNPRVDSNRVEVIGTPAKFICAITDTGYDTKAVNKNPKLADYAEIRIESVLKKEALEGFLSNVALGETDNYFKYYGSLWYLDQPISDWPGVLEISE